LQRNKEAKGYRHKVVKFKDLLSIVYNNDQANGEGARTTTESSKKMTKENDIGGKDAPFSVSSSSSLKRQRSDDSFNSMWCEKFDMLTAALKDDGLKLPSSTEVIAALQEVDGLDEDTDLELCDILTSNAQ
jgi:hypothetical protein